MILTVDGGGSNEILCSRGLYRTLLEVKWHPINWMAFSNQRGRKVKPDTTDKTETPFKTKPLGVGASGKQCTLRSQVAELSSTWATGKVKRRLSRYPQPESCWSQLFQIVGSEQESEHVSSTGYSYCTVDWGQHNRVEILSKIARTDEIWNSFLGRNSRPMWKNKGK